MCRPDANTETTVLWPNRLVAKITNKTGHEANGGLPEAQRALFPALVPRALISQDPLAMARETFAGLDCIHALKALGEETRLRMLSLLYEQQLSVNAISERLKVSQYNVSKHLRIMREAGLLETEKAGRQRLYRVAHKLKRHLAAHNNILDLGCCTFRLDKLPH